MIIGDIAWGKSSRRWQWETLLNDNNDFCLKGGDFPREIFGDIGGRHNRMRYHRIRHCGGDVSGDNTVLCKGNVAEGEVDGRCCGGRICAVRLRHCKGGIHGIWYGERHCRWRWQWQTSQQETSHGEMLMTDSMGRDITAGDIAQDVDER